MQKKEPTAQQVFQRNQSFLQELETQNNQLRLRCCILASERDEANTNLDASNKRIDELTKALEMALGEKKDETSADSPAGAAATDVALVPDSNAADR